MKKNLKYSTLSTEMEQIACIQNRQEKKQLSGHKKIFIW